MVVGFFEVVSVHVGFALSRPEYQTAQAFEVHLVHHTGHVLDVYRLLLLFDQTEVFFAVLD